MLINLGKNSFGYGYPVPTLMVATYNDDNSVNVMNLHEAMRTNYGDLALCIGPRSKTYKNVSKRKALTISLVNQNVLAAVDYFGSVSGFNVPNKFEKTGLKAVKSQYVDAPIIENCPVVIECELIEIINNFNFGTILARVVNIAADNSVIDKNGKIDALKAGIILYDPFGTNYISLKEIVGKPWSDGRKFL
ncbi:flavin reductase family protein [Campylobacter sp. RM12637]|uniref:flavin reductase family protein n=1 Tax=Campylobacter sp. RM12637 TaxID=2735734 RepID=UPI003014A8C1|nr:flavin reductase family protein [Campylobacter sp. RM12637]